MDPQVWKLIKPIQGEFTKEIVEGWHKKDLEGIVEHYDMRLRSMLKSLNEKGVYYDGLERVCPLEFYQQITRTNGSTNKEFEIAETSFFGVRAKFHFKDPKSGNEMELKNPLIFLCYTNKHGDVAVRNSLYSLQFVLSERGPSVDGVKNKMIFIRVSTYKFKVGMEIHRYYKLTKLGNNVIRSPNTVKLPANRFYNSRNERRIKNKNTAIPLLSWYVFGAYGVTESFKKFTNCEIQINDEYTLLKTCSAEDGWEVMVNGDEIHPKAMSVSGALLKEPGIAIRSTDGNPIDPLASQYAISVLFMFGVFSDTLDVRSIDNPEYWRLLIGKCSIRLPPKTSPETYLRQMTEHFISVEEYTDDITLDRYNKFNISINNTYDLFNYLIINYSNIIRTYNPADLLHKELASMEFLLENMIHSANDFKFKIRNKSNITPKIVNRELDVHFKLFGMDRSIRENNTILEQTGTDNPLIDYGLGIIIQTKSTVNRGPGKKKEEFDPNHPGNVIDASQPFVTSYQYSSGPHPDGRGFMIPRVHLVQGKYISLRPDDLAYYEATNKRIKGL